MGLGRLSPKQGAAEPPRVSLLLAATNVTLASDPAAMASHSAEGAPAPSASNSIRVEPARCGISDRG